MKIPRKCRNHEANPPVRQMKERRGQTKTQQTPHEITGAQRRTVTGNALERLTGKPLWESKSVLLARNLTPPLMQSYARSAQGSPTSFMTHQSETHITKKLCCETKQMAQWLSEARIQGNNKQDLKPDHRHQ